MIGKLYVVGTPIGNLSDFSPRARDTLATVDFIAAEDTRNSYKLLTCYGIENELVSYHEHNKAARGAEIVARLLSGDSCALVTDAGMPAISDPGEDMVVLCAELGIPVSVIPGPCAAISALALSALSTRRFVFEGFLSAQKGERRQRLSALSGEERTLIFYEAPHKLRATLEDMAEIFGENRRISLCRELTKLNEETIRTTLGEALRLYKEKEPRGEYVLIVEGGSGNTASSELVALSSLSPEEHIAHYENAGLGRMDAIKAAAKDRGMTKSELYRLVNKD